MTPENYFKMADPYSGHVLTAGEKIICEGFRKFAELQHAAIEQHHRDNDLTSFRFKYADGDTSNRVNWRVAKALSNAHVGKIIFDPPKINA